MEAPKIIAYVVFGFIFLAIWAWLSYDLKQQNAIEAQSGYTPRSQVRPFVFTLCYAMAMFAFLYVVS